MQQKLRLSHLRWNRYKTPPKYNSGSRRCQMVVFSKIPWDTHRKESKIRRICQLSNKQNKISQNYVIHGYKCKIYAFDKQKIIYI